MRDRILINKEQIPYKFKIALANEIFELAIKHNSTSDLYTVGLYKDDTLIAVEPIIYGIPLFQDIYKSGIFPALDIVPVDESGVEKAITSENFNKTVFLTVDDLGG